jgi:hypothetical protein
MSDYTEELTMSDVIFPWSPDAVILAAWTVKCGDGNLVAYVWRDGDAVK